MRNLILRSTVAALLLGLVTLLTGCNKLGLGGQKTQSTELPTAKQLKAIAYMSRAPGPDGRPAYDHLAQAKSCHDLEIAMRWNRPPDVKTGPFNDKMVYVSAGVPANLPKNSEVFFSGPVKAGRALPTGGSIWTLRLQDDTELAEHPALDVASEFRDVGCRGRAAVDQRERVLGRDRRTGAGQREATRDPGMLDQPGRAQLDRTSFGLRPGTPLTWECAGAPNEKLAWHEVFEGHD